MWQRTVGVEGVISFVFNHPFSLASAWFIFLRQSSHQSFFDSLCFVRSFPTEEIFFVMLGFVEFVSEFSSCRKCVCVSSRIYFLSLFSLICFYCSLRTTPPPALSQTQRRQTWVSHILLLFHFPHSYLEYFWMAGFSLFFHSLRKVCQPQFFCFFANLTCILEFVKWKERKR